MVALNGALDGGHDTYSDGALIVDLMKCLIEHLTVDLIVHLMADLAVDLTVLLTVD